LHQQVVQRISILIFFFIMIFEENDELIFIYNIIVLAFISESGIF
jgi:hypothetical protein